MLSLREEAVSAKAGVRSILPAARARTTVTAYWNARSVTSFKIGEEVIEAAARDAVKTNDVIRFCMRGARSGIELGGDK